ncbi:TIGR02444 family protein [Marinobacterium stanieri]|uniref:TIGR02444 family protein n=1 Tax=Marinobacterium stanieri TaxID=49186 RepID=UPI00025587AD|nr:TIGR02444 family protein [Marinobacterium stanieri]
MALENPLWHYVLRLYGAAGVESSCLALQRQGAAVNALLLACWAGQQGIPLTAARWRQLPVSWRSDVVEPLRQLRFRVREQRQQQPELDACYRALKQAELACEQVELMQLHAALVTLDWQPDAGSVVETLIRDNLAAYCDHAGVAQNTDLLETLVRATLETPDVG